VALDVVTAVADELSECDVAAAAAVAVAPDVQCCMGSIMESAMHKLVHGKYIFCSRNQERSIRILTAKMY
jgi:hypothetical protein